MLLLLGISIGVAERVDFARVLHADCMSTLIRGEKMERRQMEIKEEEGRAITSYKKHHSRPQVQTLNQVSPHPALVNSHPTSVD